MSRRMGIMSDETALEILDLVYNESLSYEIVGQRFGMSRNTIAGLCHRIKMSVEPDACHDGSMPRKWWKARKAA